MRRKARRVSEPMTFSSIGMFAATLPIPPALTVVAPAGSRDIARLRGHTMPLAPDGCGHRVIARSHHRIRNVGYVGLRRRQLQGSDDSNNFTSVRRKGPWTKLEKPHSSRFFNHRARCALRCICRRSRGERKQVPVDRRITGSEVLDSRDNKTAKLRPRVTRIHVHTRRGSVLMSTGTISLLCTNAARHEQQRTESATRDDERQEPASRMVTYTFLVRPTLVVLNRSTQQPGRILQMVSSSSTFVEGGC